MSKPSAKVYQPNEYIFKEGTKSESIYLITKGTVGIWKTKDGGHIEIGKIHANEIVGELSFFDRAPRSAAAVALTDVEAQEISFEALDKIYASVPAYLKTIMRAMAERLRHADETIKRLQRDVEDNPADPVPKASKEEAEDDDELGAALSSVNKKVDI